MKSIENAIIDAIVELLELQAPNSVGRETRLQDLGIDSGLMLELFLLIEDNVADLDIDPASLRPEHFSTVDSLATFVTQSLRQGEVA
ncbi:acyl carrier protein [Rhizobium mongolense subsp. loessense]|uniref:Acyl carrier protein n=1 Tax=Rhizobium mongolense subsp. loessense TaxID=158890 RepID=A0A1G4U5B3_9HYPH|nr:phosphopantetheine-binding protein [Rhizobium mongolense]SCW88818.1 acyl carrier protein [Rhizobium mongolense subsp. loessense]